MSEHQLDGEFADVLALLGKLRVEPSPALEKRIVSAGMKGTPAGETPANEDGQNQLAGRVSLRCTFCHDALETALAIYCAGCLAPHHEACFEEHGTCSAPGCDQTQILRPTPSGLRRKRRWKRDSLLGGLAILASGIAAAALTSTGSEHAATSTNEREGSPAHSPPSAAPPNQTPPQASVATTTSASAELTALLFSARDTRARELLEEAKQRTEPEDQLRLIHQALAEQPGLLLRAELTLWQGELRERAGDRQGAVDTYAALEKEAGVVHVPSDAIDYQHKERFEELVYQSRSRLVRILAQPPAPFDRDRALAAAEGIVAADWTRMGERLMAARLAYRLGREPTRTPQERSALLLQAEEHLSFAVDSWLEEDPEWRHEWLKALIVRVATLESLGLARVDDATEARERLKQALDDAEDMPFHVRYFLGVLEAQRGDHSRALGELRSVLASQEEEEGRRRLRSFIRVEPDFMPFLANDGWRELIEQETGN